MKGMAPTMNGKRKILFGCGKIGGLRATNASQRQRKSMKSSNLCVYLSIFNELLNKKTRRLCLWFASYKYCIKRK